MGRIGGRPLAVLAACALLGGCAGAGTGALEPGPSGPGLVNTEEQVLMQIVDVVVPGPAAEAEAAAPETAGVNRLGSAEVRARHYEPDGSAWATLVWAHGGSFMRGTLDWPESDWVSQRFAEAGVRVYSVDYGLASDAVKAPGPANDVAAVLGWAAAEHAGPIVVGGASAGAHLAVLAALAQEELAAASAADSAVRPADALILEYPTLHRVQREDPVIAAATAELPELRRFDAARIAEMYAYYLGEGDDPLADSPLVAGELPAERLAALPPTVIVNAELDDLRASGEEFAEQLRAAGVPVAESLQPGALHGYLNRPEESPAARADAQATIDRFVAELRRILGA